MIKIALLGFGTVGSGVAEVLTENRKTIAERVGEEIDIKYILDLREFPDHPLGDRVVHDIGTILADKEVTVVAEMMGGSHPAYDFTKSALEAGKSVVTSNKEVVANYGAELLEIARQNGVKYLFEASVGGGIPIIRPVQDDLLANEIQSVDGILNGTTNFILTKMDKESADFAETLKEAQKLGYAEANPTADVDGLDPARKIVILSALAYGVLLSPEKIKVCGIRNITKEQTEIAKSLGCTVKLVGHCEKIGEKVLALVEPHAVPDTCQLYHVNGVFNGILTTCNMLGKAFFYGAGAGKLPTASAVTADIMHAGRDEKAVLPHWKVATAEDYANPDDRKVRRLFVLQGCKNCAEKAKEIFGYETYTVQNGTFAFLSKPMTNADVANAFTKCHNTQVLSMPVVD